MAEDSEYGPFLTRRRRGNVLTHFITAVLGAGLAVVLLLAFYSPASGGSGSSVPGSGMVPAPAASAPPLGKSAQDIAARVRPGVVVIDTTLRYDSERAAGTGMVINASGLVLTNNHVIDDSTSITATVPATGRTYRATVLGYDKSGDIALIRLQGASGLVTIGYPPFLGIFVGTGSDSSPQDQAQQGQQGQQQHGSGGSQACSASNAGLAGPSAIAPVSAGVLVDGTICGGPAAHAGLTAGAVITAINGQPVGSPDQLGNVLARFHPGDTISVTWVSPVGQRTTSSLRLTAGPPQ